MSGLNVRCRFDKSVVVVPVMHMTSMTSMTSMIRSIVHCLSPYHELLRICKFGYYQ